MKKLDFITDVLNPILYEDPMASLIPLGGQAIDRAENTTQVMASCSALLGVDFALKDSPKDVASKLLRVCLAELSAKGAVGKNCALVLCLGDEISANWVNGFGVGLVSELQEFGLSVVNCETRTGQVQTFVSVSCIGELVGVPLSSAGAIAGDIVCVSGQVGLAALGRHISQGRDFGFLEHQNERFVEAFQKPNPNWALGSFLVDQAKAHAAVNISHGLVPDLHRITMHSGVGVNLDLSAIDFADRSLPVGEQLFESADHQLIICLPAANVEHLQKWFPQARAIGYVTSDDGVQMMDKTGGIIDVDALSRDRIA